MLDSDVDIYSTVLIGKQLLTIIIWKLINFLVSSTKLN